MEIQIPSSEETNALKNYRIFHIGNIANNAFNSAQLERRMGLNSFVISPNYFHVMGFPIWETENISVNVENHFNPRFFLNKYQLPHWFLWGNWEQILETLTNLELVYSENRLIKLRRNFLSGLLNKLQSFREKYGYLLKIFINLKLRHFFVKHIFNRVSTLVFSEKDLFFSDSDILVFYGPFNYLVKEFNLKNKYISMEHGTLREWIFTDDIRAVESREAYKNSNIVLITNQDCLEPALRIGVNPDNIIRTPHPSSDDDLIKLRASRYNFISDKIKFTNEYPARILYPARHTYPSKGDIGKGNEDVIQSLALVVAEFPEIEVLMVEWGADVDRSKRLIEAVGLKQHVKWSSVMSRKMLKEEMVSANLVIDQFKIDGYGAILADAIGIGVPVVSRQNANLDLEFFGCIPPILGANSTEEIVSKIRIGLISLDAENHFNESTKWYDNHLSSFIALKARIEAYKRIVC